MIAVEDSKKVCCTNCGKSVLEEAARRCTRYDCCISSQNLAILRLDNPVPGTLARYSRSLCFKCWYENNFTCCHCELELGLSSGEDR